MGDVIDHIATEFTSSELVLIAEKSGLAPTSRWGNRKLIDAILHRLDITGVPEPPIDDDMSKSELLVEEFLYVGGFVDDSGNVIEKKGEDNGEELETFMVIHNIKKLPDCFTYADDEAPSCKRCILYKFCAQIRLENLPPCYAILWENNNPECEACLEQPFCKIKVKINS